jgi:hypothetical protein
MRYALASSQLKILSTSMHHGGGGGSLGIRKTPPA